MDVMTWKEFVEVVEESMEKQGMGRDVEIYYIDTGNFPTKNGLEVVEHQERGWLIVHGDFPRVGN